MVWSAGSVDDFLRGASRAGAMAQDDRTAATPPTDGIYRTIQWLMIADVVIGLALVFIGEAVLRQPAMSLVGAGLVVVGGGVLAIFRTLARREAARRASGRQ